MRSRCASSILGNRIGEARLSASCKMAARSRSLSLKAALEEKAARSSGGVSSIVTAALARYLEKPIHTIFQVPTSSALVAGIYDREVSVQ
jgi:hypothetical protein